MAISKEQAAFPKFISPQGEIFTCIFFATKTPPGIEWFGFRIEQRDDDDILFYGLVDTVKRELAFFSLNDLLDLDAQCTDDPEIINRISLPAGWRRYEPVVIGE